MTNHLPTDAKARKALPLATGCLDYFPDALAEVAELSRIGNDQHNPGQPLHWSKHKSSDHDDCIVRHLVDRGTRDTDKVRHRTKVAWRALAALQIEIEADRAGLSQEDYLAKLKADAEAPQSSTAPWSPWHGTQKYPPINIDSLVDVQFRDGTIAEGGPAGTWTWLHGYDAPYDIVAYRLSAK